jgi:hypothetical protein
LAESDETLAAEDGPLQVMTHRWTTSVAQDRDVERSQKGVHGGFIGCCILAEAFGLLFLVGDVAQTFFEGGDLAEPPHSPGLVEAFVCVGFDLEQAW